MKPKELVPTAVTCKRLQAAGFPQKTMLSRHHRYGLLVHSNDGLGGDHPDYIAAPTLAEILAELPTGFRTEYAALLAEILAELPTGLRTEYAALLYLALKEVNAEPTPNEAGR